MSDKISQPKDTTFTSSSGDGKLTWKKTFSTQRSSHFDKIQKYVDSEVLRYCDPLIPKQTGSLINSGTTGTTLGSGEVKYTAPYAAYQYYREDLNHSGNLNPQGGAKWFERMKTANLDDIKSGAEKLSM